MKPTITRIIVSALALIIVTVSSAQTNDRKPVSNIGADSLSAVGKPFDIEQWWQRKEPADHAPIAISEDGTWLAVPMRGIIHLGDDSNRYQREGSISEVVSPWLLG